MTARPESQEPITSGSADPRRLPQESRSTLGTGTGPRWLYFVTFLPLLLLLSLVIKIANFRSLLASMPGFAYSPGRPPFTLPLLLGEEVLAGGALAVLLALLCRGRAGRIAARSLGTLALLFLAADQLAFKYFFGHVNLALYQEGHEVGILGSSILGAMDAAFVIVLTLAVASSILLWVGPRLEPVRRWGMLLLRRRWPVGGALLATVLVTYLLVAWQEQYDLHRSAWVELAASLVPRRNPPARPPASQVDWQLRRLLHGRAQPPEELDDLLARRPARPLNVVWFVFESLPYRETSMNPHNPQDPTPFLKELAGRGLLFDQYYTTFPGSTRSNWSALTGTQPYLDVSSDLGRYVATGRPILTDLLAQHGYRTALYSSSDTRFDGVDLLLLRHAYDKYFDVNNLTPEQKRGRFMTTWGIEEAPAIEQALAWVREQAAGNQPFFLHYLNTFPHHPYDLPPSAAALAQKPWDRAKRKYQASLNYADAMVRLLYDGLEQLGLADSTLFIVTPDHGEAFSDLHARNRLHMDQVYEENVRIWLLLHNRPLIPAGRVSHRVGNQLDFQPTLLELLGLPIPAEAQGQSLVSAQYVERPLFFGSRGQLGLRDGHHKLVHELKRKRSLLFDLSQDPDEQTDLASREPALVREYERYVLAWQAALKAEYGKLAADYPRVAKQVEQENRQLRQKQFGDRPDPIAAQFLCTEATVATCQPPPPGAPVVFDGREPLVLKIRWKQPGSYVGPIIWYMPDGGRAQSLRTLFQEVTDSSTVKLDATYPLAEGNWRVYVNMEGGHVTHFVVAR